MIKLGEYNTLEVIRKSDLGYMLSDEKIEILMHYRQSNKELEIGELVTVFVYADKEKRLTATMQEPFCDLEKPGFVSVVNIIEGSGVFVNINTPKDIFISKDYLPYNSTFWPKIDDVLFIRLKKKGDSLVGKPLNRFEIDEQKSPTHYAELEQVDGYVYHVTENGISIVTKDVVSIFVPKTQLRGTFRLGEMVNVTITKVSSDACYGTLNQHKEILMDEDKDLILNYLRKNGGVINLTSKSSAEEIEAALHISRKAFKRA